MMDRQSKPQLSLVKIMLVNSPLKGYFFCDYAIISIDKHEEI